MKVKIPSAIMAMVFLTGCVPTGFSLYQETGIHVKLDGCVFPPQDSKKTDEFNATMDGFSTTCNLTLLNDRSTNSMDTYEISLASADFQITPESRTVSLGTPVSFHIRRKEYRKLDPTVMVFTEIHKDSKKIAFIPLNIKVQ